MLGWLRRRAFNKNRLIFRFFDGEKSRWVDPLAAWFSLRNDSEFVADEHFPLLDDSPPGEKGMLADGRVDAWEITGRAIGRAFDLEDETLTLWERRQLAVRFLIYLNELKKNISILPISLPPSVLETLEGWHTKLKSDSTSTPDERKPAVLGELS